MPPKLAVISGFSSRLEVLPSIRFSTSSRLGASQRIPAWAHYKARVRETARRRSMPCSSSSRAATSPRATSRSSAFGNREADMKKMIDGQVVDMSAEEIARRQAEDAAFKAAEDNPPPPPRDPPAEIDELDIRNATRERRP